MRFKSYLKYILPLVLFGLLAFLYGFASTRNASKKIAKIEVEFEAGDNHFLTHHMVNKLLIQNQKSVVNQPKSMLDLHGLEQSVLTNPYVEKASVFASINGVLKTVIKQREPIARLIEGSTSYYVDSEGVKIPLSQNFSARVLLVSGIKSDTEIKEITQLVNLILSDNFLKKEVTGIQKNGAGEYVFNVRSGEYKIEFGNFINADLKFKKLKAFYNKAYADKTIDNYQTINVKYHNQVVCTK